jgi:hypothetical protein
MKLRRFLPHKFQANVMYGSIFTWAMGAFSVVLTDSQYLIVFSYLQTLHVLGSATDIHTNKLVTTSN